MCFNVNLLLRGKEHDRIIVGNDPVNLVDPEGLIFGPVIDGVATIGTILTGAYFYGSVKWTTEINDLIREAQEKLFNELDKGCHDEKYAQALKDYIDKLTELSLINTQQAIMYGLGLTKPFSDMPILPSPPNKPQLPSVPAQ